MPPEKATLLGTDNLANALVGSGTGSATKSRPFLRRYYTFLQRVRKGLVDLRHIDGTQNPADFLTKWLKGAKLRDSIAYITNVKSRPPVRE